MFPPAPEVNLYLQAGMQLRQAGRATDAENEFRRILEIEPTHAGALMLLGISRHEAKDFASAAALFSRAVVTCPEAANLRLNLAFALKALGKVEEAIDSYLAAIRLQPNYPKASYNLAVALQELGRVSEAEQFYRQAIAGESGHIEAHVNLFLLLAGANRYDESLDAAERAWRARPDVMRILMNYAINLSVMGRLEEAKRIFSQAEELIAKVSAKERVNYHASMALHLGFTHKYKIALQHLDIALALDPDDAPVHRMRAEFLLARGEWAHGWMEYEWRLKDPLYTLQSRPRSLPTWDGSAPGGRTILLTCEQGMGDTIQFLRFVPAVAAAGADVILQVQAPLVEMAASVRGVRLVIPAGSNPCDAPVAQLHLPILSLAATLHVSEKTLARDVPYITVPPAHLARWAKRFGDERTRPRVGIAWAGNPSQSGDRWRSMHSGEFLPLLQVHDLEWYGIQKGDLALQKIRNLPPSVRFTSLDPELHSMADTAAAMSCFDLIVTTDTSTAHLAGALGKPVWTLLNYYSDWRYGLQRSDCVWYPTMRLFRQTSPGDWVSLIRDVNNALSKEFSGEAS